MSLIKTEQNLATICLLTLTIIAIAMVLTFTKTVSVPFVFSLFLYLVISPFMNYLQRKLKISQTLSLIFTIVIFLSLTTLLIFLTVDSFGGFLQQASSYGHKIKTATLGLAMRLEEFGIFIPREKLINLLQNLPFISWVQSFSGSLLFIIGNFFLISVFTFFLLIGENKADIPDGVFVQIKKSISKYVNTKLFTSVGTGVIMLVIYLAFSVELAFMFALLTILLNFIPNIGSIVATILPTPVLFLQYEFGWKFWAVLILSGITQLTIGSLIEPKLMSDNIGLHPVAILFFLTFWGLIWGIPGMFLAVPITATLKIILSQFPLTSPLALLLEGKWE